MQGANIFIASKLFSAGGFLHQDRLPPPGLSREERAASSLWEGSHLQLGSRPKGSVCACASHERARETGLRT